MKSVYLVEVTVTVELCVLAKTEKEAATIAFQRWHRDAGSECVCVTSMKKATSLSEIPSNWRKCLPWTKIGAPIPEHDVDYYVERADD